MSEVNYGEVKKNGPDGSEEKPNFPTEKEIINGLLIFVGGSALGLVIFLLSMWALSYFDIGYLLVAIIALAVSVMLIWALDKSMGFKNSKMQAAVITVLCLAFLFTILIGHKNHGSPFKHSSYKVLKSETFTFSSKEVQRWVTQNEFKKGMTYRVIISGMPVNLVNGKEYIRLEPSVNPYSFTTQQTGYPTFDGIISQGGGRCTVRIEWAE